MTTLLLFGSSFAVVFLLAAQHDEYRRLIGAGQAEPPPKRRPGLFTRLFGSKAG